MFRDYLCTHTNPQRHVCYSDQCERAYAHYLHTAQLYLCLCVVVHVRISQTNHYCRPISELGLALRMQFKLYAGKHQHTHMKANSSQGNKHMNIYVPDIQ